ncbi:hypothetical protein ELR70_22750 [Pseudoalteromonas sp. R3]|nr:hypothetical protein ELR70_22750 [Pseudoalteromonas sp. R3]
MAIVDFNGRHQSGRQQQQYCRGLNKPTSTEIIMKTVKQTQVLVGNKFTNFAQNPGVTTYEQARTMLETNDEQLSTTQFVLGQGICADAYQALLNLAEEKGMAAAFATPSFNKLNKQETHKHQKRNGMLGEPQQIEDNLYRLPIYIDDACDEMGDHVTGHHIQGMVLTESARQAFLAITERYFLADAEKSYFVINSLDSEYLSFAFPLPLELEYRILSFTDKGRGTLCFDVEMTLSQNGQDCARVKTKFSTYPEKFLSRKEGSMAKQAVEHLQTALAEQGAVCDVAA